MGVGPLRELVHRPGGSGGELLHDEELGAPDAQLALGVAGGEAQHAEDPPEGVERAGQVCLGPGMR